jgi:hypothetical protein
VPDSAAVIAAKIDMRDFELIHATDDMHQVLLFCADIGLIIRHDVPTEKPLSKIIYLTDICMLTNGSFCLYRPEWVFEEPKFDIIDSGHNEGKYFQNPATNYVSINLYFSGERKDRSGCRLGSGNLTYDVNWYRSSDHTLHVSPPDVKGVFNEIRKHMDTGRRLRGGVHNYAVLQNAWDKLIGGSALPPFDYIEWPPNSAR